MSENLAWMRLIESSGRTQSTHPAIFPTVNGNLVSSICFLFFLSNAYNLCSAIFALICKKEEHVFCVCCCIFGVGNCGNRLYLRFVWAVGWRGYDPFRFFLRFLFLRLCLSQNLQRIPQWKTAVLRSLINLIDRYDVFLLWYQFQDNYGKPVSGQADVLSSNLWAVWTALSNVLQGGRLFYGWFFFTDTALSSFFSRGTNVFSCESCRSACVYTCSVFSFSDKTFPDSRNISPRSPQDPFLDGMDDFCLSVQDTDSSGHMRNSRLVSAGPSSHSSHHLSKCP